MKEFDELLNLKKKIEEFSPTLTETYNNINKIIENLDCLDTEKFDQIMSLLKEYSADIEKIKTDFLLSPSLKPRFVVKYTLLIRRAFFTNL